jgi:hypothetical protein
MLLPVATVEALVAGRIRSVYRRWASPRAKVGGRQRTHLGELRVEAIEELAPDALTETDAQRGGYRDLAALRESMAGREGRVFRIDLVFAGVDPRIALRQQADLSAGDLDDLARALARKDRSEPWTEVTLRHIAAEPGRRAADVATALGEDRTRLKRRVRQLKELGLTESLEVGYRLSPRGTAWLEHLGGEGLRASQSDSATD